MSTGTTDEQTIRPPGDAGGRDAWGARDARPRAATRSGRPLRAELGRLSRRRLVLALVALGLLALLAALTLVFLTHDQDLAGAHAKAVAAAAQQERDQATYRQQCLADPNIPQADKDAGACGPAGPTPVEPFFRDPRLRADVGLPLIAIGVAVGGALLAALIGATGVGADWSSRAMITLLTWEPRRLRLLGTRFAAIALFVGVLGVAVQALGLGLGALVVTTRGTWQPSGAAVAPDGAGGAADAGAQPGGLVPPAHFWRDLLSLELRGVALMVLAAVLAAAVTTLTRHTGGLLAIAFAWFAVAENAVRLLFADRGWPRWLVSQNIAAFLVPGGLTMPAGTSLSRTGQLVARTVLVSNLDALLYLGGLTGVALLLAAVAVRRDL